MSELKTKVIDQQINGVPMEDYMAKLLERLDKNELEKREAELKIAAYKQLNLRHKNIIDAYRIAVKSLY